MLDTFLRQGEAVIEMSTGLPHLDISKKITFCKDGLCGDCYYCWHRDNTVEYITHKYFDCDERFFPNIKNRIRWFVEDSRWDFAQIALDQGAKKVCAVLGVSHLEDQLGIEVGIKVIFQVTDKDYVHKENVK